MEKTVKRPETGNFQEEASSPDLKNLGVDQEINPEAIRELQKLTGEKILAMERNESDFLASRKAIEDALSISGEKETGKGILMKEKMDALWRKFKENGKKKMLIMTLGMSILGSAGIGEFKKVEAAEIPKDKNGTESLLKNKAGIAGVRTKKEIPRKTKKSLSSEDKKKYEVLKEKSQKIANEIFRHISSDAYLEKLKIEFNGSYDVAKIAQRARIENFKNLNIYVMSSEEVNRRFKEGVSNFSGKVSGFYIPISHEIFLCSDKNYFSGGFIHELLHAITKGNRYISNNAKKILADSYKSLGDGKDNYFSDPTEILVRKQILDKEMEELNIKKYKEEFTSEHHKKIIGYYKRGLFSRDAMDFIKRTKPKYFKKIFDEIAKNEKEDDVVAV